MELPPDTVQNVDRPEDTGLPLDPPDLPDEDDAAWVEALDPVDDVEDAP